MKYNNLFLIGLFVLLLAGCTSILCGEREQMLSPLPIPTVHYIVPTFTQTPNPTTTPTLTLTPTPPPPPVVTRESMLLFPNCTVDGAWTKCNDDLLDITFSYPSEWGSIQARLHRGMSDGYGYNYQFGNGDADNLTATVVASGRSIDYSEPRGGTVADFYGFGDKSSQDICSKKAICEVIQPGVIFYLSFVDAKFVCDFNQGVYFYPFASVAINLPQHNLINGFVFMSKFLSAHQEQQLFSILEIDETKQPHNCSEASRQFFDQAVNQLTEQIRTGAIDEETKHNLDILRQLATTLVSNEISE